jgi:pyruvate dehydrogenase E1 component alpha subunit
MEKPDRARAYELMCMSRHIDEECKRLLADGVPVPNYHSGTGQEALSVGVGLAAGPDDYVLFTYRDFGMLLAKGVSPVELAGDLLLTTAGTTRGHGGIMHVSAPARGIVGRNSIFGSRFGIAIGLAKAALIKGERRAVLCAFGEAEGGRGVLYEALNMACLQGLPVIFVAENNGYSISSRTADIYASGDMSGMFRAAPLPTAVVDGNDVEAVYGATTAALQYARSNLAPFFLELKTYRIDPHIPADVDSQYRTADEVEFWRRRDPITRFAERLLADGFTREDLAGIESRAGAEVTDALRVALESPPPDLRSMYEYLYYPQGHWSASVRGPHA